MMSVAWVVAVVLVVGVSAVAPAAGAGAAMPDAGGMRGTQVESRVAWAEFLGRHDLVWEQLPLQWNEGAWLGNGQLGLMVYATTADNRIDFHLGRVDVTDHRGAPDRKTSRGIPGRSVMYDFCRLDVGRMALRPAGRVLDGGVRVDLWNAEMRGTVRTDRGEIRFRAVTVYDRMVHAVEVESTEVDGEGRPLPWRWEFLPGNPMSPRAQVFPDHAESKAYVTNPPPVVTVSEGGGECVQPLLAGGDYATVWRERRAGSRGLLAVSTANEVPASGKSLGVARADVEAAMSAGMEGMLPGHRAWWHAYYPRSFVSIPDARMEAFYWIQMFKLGCVSRPDAPPQDTSGPFFRVTQWPGLWWNLNVQVTYWPVYAANRLEQGENLLRELDTNFDGLLRTFAPKPNLGDFAWVMHNYWLHLRYAGDWEGIATRWVPKARQVAAAYDKKLKRNADGKLELLPMESPEWEGFKTYDNSTYNLALLRWLLGSLIEAETRSGRGAGAEVAAWRATLADLIPFPVDERGLMIGSKVSVTKSHRHFSHLLSLYPLFVLNPDDPADRELVVRSVVHWHRVDGGKELAGYSFTGGAALYAALGMGDEAYGLLRQFLTGKIGISQLHASTIYVESGGRNPVLETPMTAASATHELLLQSWGGKLRVFPAVPKAWRQARFGELRGEGAFLVSAARDDGATRWVHVRSEAGERCIVKVPEWTGELDAKGDRAFDVREIAPGEYEVDLRRGEQVLLFPKGRATTAILDALPIAPDDRNLYGVKRGKQIRQNQSWPEVPIGATRPPTSPTTRPATRPPTRPAGGE